MSDAPPAVLKEGYLKKHTRHNNVIGSNWRRRYFRLYPGELVYLLSPQDSVERRRISLGLDSVVTQTNDQGYAHCFSIKMSPTADPLYLQAENEDEKIEWATAVFTAARRTPDVAPSGPEVHRPTSPVTPTPPAPPDRTLLHLNVVEAKGLIAADMSGKSDPYCIVNLVGKNGQLVRSEEVKTSYVTNTLEAVWNQHFTIGKAVDLRTVESVHVELWDHDHITKDSSLGFVKIPLSVFRMSPASTAQSELVDRWFRVEPPQATQNTMFSSLPFGTSGSSSPRREKEEKEVMIKPHGELHLVMSIAGPNLVEFFQSVHLSIAPQNRIVMDGVEHTDNRLEVTVLAAKDLISADFNQSSDPYVELALLDDKGKTIRGESYTTGIKYKTRNPAWENEQYVFGRISRIDEATRLRVRVLDWDKHSKNDPLGTVTIDLDNLSGHNQTQWFDLQPEQGMAIRENLGSVQLTISLVGETPGERKRRVKIHKEVTAKTHEQSKEQLELENAQHELYDAACKLDGARIACAVNDYQARQPQFYGVNGCIHHLNTQIPRAHREKTSTDEIFQARAGVEGQASLEVSVIGTYELRKSGTSMSSNPYAVIEMEPPVCVEECKRTSAPLSPQKSKRIEAMNAAASEARNPMFLKRVQAEVSSHRTKLTKNEMRSEKRLELSQDRPVLKVEIKSGHGFSGVDMGGYSDPYCTLTLTDRTTGKPVDAEKKRTAIVSKTLNPVWENEVFHFGSRFPLSDAGMLLIHVKDHNNIGRSTPLGRVQIPLSELCHGSATSTSISSTAREKRYALTPEPWMKKHAQNLGELCIKTEVVGDATLLAEMLQRDSKGSPEKMLSFLSMSSFSSDPYIAESQGGGLSSINLSSMGEDEDEVTEVIEKGKQIRTSTVVGSSVKWRKEKFTLSLSYPGMFSNGYNDKDVQYTLRLRVLSARKLLLTARTDDSTSSHGRQFLGRLDPTSAYFTVIPVLASGQLDHPARKQSLTVYGTQSPNWPEQEFLFGKQKDISLISYLSLHVYTRDLATEIKRPLQQLLTSQESQQVVRLKRYWVHKVGPSGDVEDDGLEVLPYDQHVLAFRSCADGGRFFPARIRGYVPYPEDEYEVQFEDGVENIEDVRNLFSLDVKGQIKVIHADGSVDIRLINDEETSGMPKKEIYARNVPQMLITPVDGFTSGIEAVMARQIDVKSEESKRWNRLKHTLSALRMEVLSVSDLPNGVQRPGCLVSLLGNPLVKSSNDASRIRKGRNGELIIQGATANPLWKSGEPLVVTIPFANTSEDVSDLFLLEEKLMLLGKIEDKTSSQAKTSEDKKSSDEIDAQQREEILAEDLEVITHCASLLFRVVDQGSDNVPKASHPTIGFVRVDLASLRDGDQELNVKLVPSKGIPYYKQVGSISLQVSCQDASSQKDEVQLKNALKAAGHDVSDTSLVDRRVMVCGTTEWFRQRMAIEQQPKSPTQSTKGSKPSLTRITRRQLLRASLTSAENAQVDAFNAVMTVIMKRVVSILCEIKLFEEFEELASEEMPKFRHIHSVNADPNSDWIGRHINEIDHQTRKDIVVELEMELLDISASDLPREYPAPNIPREEWIQMRAVRQKELQKVGTFFMEDRTSSVVLGLPCCFTGEGMISWMLRAPKVLWRDEWTKYCYDVGIKESSLLHWDDEKLALDPDSIQAPRSRELALIWLNALGDAGYVENVSPSLSTSEANIKYYLVEDKPDRFYRLREVETWLRKIKRDKSLFPLDLVREFDCYQESAGVWHAQSDDANKPSSPKKGKKVESPKNAAKQLPAGEVKSVAEVPVVKKKTYAKKLTEHVEGFLGTTNMFSSLLFSPEVQQNTLLKPVAMKTQQLVAEQLLWEWKYCLFIPAHKSIYMYDEDTSTSPTIIIDMSSTVCHTAYNFAYDAKGGWFEVVNGTVLHKQGDQQYKPLTSDLQEKLLKVKPDGNRIMELKTPNAQRWMQAFVRSGIRVDMKPGQLVILKQVNPTVLQQKCIHYVTDFNPKNLEDSFQRLLNRFFGHDVEASHQEHEQKLRDMRTKLRNELKKSGKIGETVMAYFGKGTFNPKPTNERMYTRGALYSARIVRIRTPFTDAKYRFTQTYELNNAPPAMQNLLVKYKVVDKASWLKLAKSLRDLFLLYDVEYRHAHEVIVEEGMMREHLRANDGDLDSVKVEERCTDLNLVFKASDLEDCITRMVLHSGGRKPLGCVKIPIKMVSPHRSMDVWLPLAPENEMVQKVKLGQLRVQLKLEQTKQVMRSKKTYAALLDEVKDAMAQQQVQPASPTSPSTRFKFRMPSGRSTKQLASSSPAPGFTISRERTFLKVTVVEGRKLITKDYFTSDPFVKLVLVREKDGKEEFTKLKTDVKSSTLSPKWQNQEFVLGKTEATMLSDKKSLILRVMDEDLGSPDDPMGCLRLEFQRDKTGAITGLVLVHADENGNAATKALHLDDQNRIEVDERLLADESAGQKKSDAARGNNGAADGKLGRLRFSVEVIQNENYIDSNAMNTAKVSAAMKTLETKFSLEVALKKAAPAGTNASAFTGDVKQFTCMFIPQGEGGQRIHYDPNAEDLGIGNSLRLAELLQSTSTSDTKATTKILGRTYDMSMVAYFDVKVTAEAQGKLFQGQFGQQGQFRNPENGSVFRNEVIVLKDKDNKGLELHITLDVNIVAIHRAERLQRLLAETFRLVGLQFDGRLINEEASSSLNESETEGRHSSGVGRFLWDACKVHLFPGQNIAQALIAQLHRMALSTKLHWKLTPQLLGFILEHVFLYGEKDRLKYEDAVMLDTVLQRWSHVLQQVNEAKTQLIGHLDGQETPRLMHSLMNECDWSGFEFASIPSASNPSKPGSSDAAVEDYSSPKENLLRVGTKVHALLPPGKHAGVAVDVLLTNGQYVAGTITAEYGDDSFDVAFCTSAKVREEGDEYFSDDEELPPLIVGQTVFVCPIAQAEVAGRDYASGSARPQPGRIGKVEEFDDAHHASTPYRVKYADPQEPQEEWTTRLCLDSMLQHIVGSDLHLQLSKEDFVRVYSLSPETSTDGSASKATGGTRTARVTKNHRNARYDVEYLDGQQPATEKQVPRDRLEPGMDKTLYQGEVKQVYLEEAKGTFAIKYDLVLKNGDAVDGLVRDQLRVHSECLATDKVVLASLFAPGLNIQDKNSASTTHTEIAKRVSAAWSSECVVKVYVMMRTKPQSIHLRDNVSTKHLQAKIHERDEHKPRFVDQCHGYVRGENFSEVEESALQNIYATRGHIERRKSTEQDELDVDNCFCLYLAPQPRIALHGMLRISPGETPKSRALFASLLGFAVSNRARCSRLLQRLLRSAASEHMPLNRKERVVAMKKINVCFYREAAANVTLNALTSTCDGTIVKGDKEVVMRRIELAHVCLQVVFDITVPHNNRGSLSDALTVANQDAGNILSRLVGVKMLELVAESGGTGIGDSLDEGRWLFSSESSAASSSLVLEILDASGKKDSKPALSLEMTPLENQRLSVQDVHGNMVELCLPVESILREAHMRRQLAPYYTAEVLGGPISTETEGQTPSHPTIARSTSKPPPSYRVKFEDSSGETSVLLKDIKFDTLRLQVVQASQLILKEKMGEGNITVDILLKSSDFKPQLEGDAVLKTPFGLSLTEAGDIVKDLNNKPCTRSLTLKKQQNATDWLAPADSSCSFGLPSFDISRVSGVVIKLHSDSTKKLVGETFIPIKDIQVVKQNESITQVSTASSEQPVSASKQTFSLYRTEQGHRYVVGKIKLQVERTQQIKTGDVVQAKRFKDEEDAWSISESELLATTLKVEEDQLLRGLLATGVLAPSGGHTLLTDVRHQELQLQKLVTAETISNAMHGIYATKSDASPTMLTLKDGSQVNTSGLLDQLRQLMASTRWFIADTAAEFGIHSSGKRLPWSSDQVKDDTVAMVRDQVVVMRANVTNAMTRVRRTILKLYNMYHHRLIPTLQRLYELDAMGDHIDVKAGEQLLAFFEDEVEDLNPRDQTVYRRVYRRLRLMKIAQVLQDIMQTTLRVTIMDQDHALGDVDIGTAFIPLLDLLDQLEHDNYYDLTKTRQGMRENPVALRGQASAKLMAATPNPNDKKPGKVHLRIHLSYSESSLLEQATNVYKFIKAKYIVQHETARRRINAAVIPAQRRRWMTIKGYLDELKFQSLGKLHWERTPVLLSLVWDIFVTTSQEGKSAKNDDSEHHLEGLAERASDYRAAVVEVHKRWANLQPMLEELLKIQGATQIHAQRTPELLGIIEREVEGLDLVLSTAWQQVHQKWMVLYNALEELAGMQERNKLHLGRAPQLLNLVTQKCSKGLNERHADAVSNVQFRWMAITQRDGPLCELRLMEKNGLHWRRTHELVMLLNEQCEGFAEIDAKALESVHRRWEQVQEWLDDIVQMQEQHRIDCEATPFILKQIHLLDKEGARSKQRSKTKHADKKTLQSPLSSQKGAGSSRLSQVSSASGAAPTEAEVITEVDVGRLEGLVEWYAIEEAKRELERIPHHRITTDHDKNNWLPYSQGGKDTRLIITQEEMAITAQNIRMALVDRGVIPHMSTFDGLSPAPAMSPTRSSSSSSTATTALPKDLMKEIQELERAIENKHLDDTAHSYVQWNPERVAELYLVIESLGKSDLLWKIEHVVNTSKELEVPSNFLKLLEAMKMRQIPTTEMEDLVRTLTMTMQKEELLRRGVDVPSNANFTAVLALMHRHQVKDVTLPNETSAIQTLLQERGMDKKGDAVFLRGMRIGTQSWHAEDQSSKKTPGRIDGAVINSNLGIMDTQIEQLRKSLLFEALRKRNSVVKTFPGQTQIFTEEDLAECTEVDTSGDYMTLIERFQQLLIQESYTKRLAEYAALDRCMRALLRVPRDQVVTKEDIALALQSVGSRFRLPLEAFTREELIEAASQGRIRTPTEEMLSRCPSGRNAKAMAHYAAVSYAAMVFEETASFPSRLDPVSMRFVDAMPYDESSSVNGMSIPKDRSRMNLKQYVIDWLMGSEESIVQIQRRIGEYQRQRLMWATAAYTLRNRWFHRAHGWCDALSEGAGVKVLMEKLLVFAASNKMHMMDTEALLNEINQKCVNLRARERQAKESLELVYHANLEMLEKLVGHAEKCINNRRLHTEDTPALLHAIEQVCIVPQGLSLRHREAYHVVTSHWIPHRARLAELVQMHKEGTFSIHRTPELLSAMEFHTEGIGGAEALSEEKIVAMAHASQTTEDVQQQFFHKKVDEIRRGQRKQASSLQLDLQGLNTDRDVVLEEMKEEQAGNNNEWQSLSPSKRVVQPLSPLDKQTSWKMSAETTGSPKASAVILENRPTVEKRRKSSIGDEIKEILRSPSKWLMAASEPEARIRPEQFFPLAVSHNVATSEANVAAVPASGASNNTPTTT
ncbi:hypothetical protein Poli38472_005904 [Pythium oligandrum]|uniref:Uncharacterized protein n=1 Tax=Pythium oligandrum TaxID=41045 RepID=A0A8K1CRE5_PYTOL|nr:hypothetical protein Poli38472_005904 [Pythium oligandrum]|eukprot:TMW68436.1 hypothetical protein Poli38472_005904 [Pythium oligandrum]